MSSTSRCESLRQTAHDGLAEPGSFWQVEPPSIIIESVKKAEDGRGWIMRLYEASGSSVRHCTVTTKLRITGATLTDLLENEVQPLACSDGQIALDFHPFEIKTMRLVTDV